MVKIAAVNGLLKLPVLCSACGRWGRLPSLISHAKYSITLHGFAPPVKWYSGLGLDPIHWGDFELLFWGGHKKSGRLPTSGDRRCVFSSGDFGIQKSRVARRLWHLIEKDSGTCSAADHSRRWPRSK